MYLPKKICAFILKINDDDLNNYITSFIKQFCEYKQYGNN